MASDPQPASLPAAVQVTRFWSANRRLVLLASLATGLALVFIWLPGEARSGLVAALLAQSALVGLLFLFALVAMSLVWSAGQRQDARILLEIGAPIALCAFAGLVGLTRVYVGAHYPRHVIAGAVLGSVWGVLAALVDRYWFWLRF